MIFAKFSVIWISLSVPLRRHFIKYFCRTVPDFHNTEELHNSRRSFCPGLFVLRSLSSGANWSAWSIDLYQHLFYLNLIRISRGILFARDRSDQFDSFLRFNINDIASEIPIVLPSTPGNVSVDFARCWESDKEVYISDFISFVLVWIRQHQKIVKKKHVHPISLPHYDWGPWGGRGPEGGWAPKSDPRWQGEAQNVALFSLSRFHFRFFHSLSLSPGPSNVHAWKSRVVLWNSGGPKNAEVSDNSPRAQTCTFGAPAFKKPPKFDEKTQRKRERGEKKSDILGCVAWSRRGSKSTTTTHNTIQHKNWLADNGQAQIGHRGFWFDPLGGFFKPCFFFCPSSLLPKTLSPLSGPPLPGPPSPGPPPLSPAPKRFILVATTSTGSDLFRPNRFRPIPL